VKQAYLPLRHELIVVNFAGGGGACKGIVDAIGRPIDVAINHDPEAIAMHAANHPQTQHYCEDVFAAVPIEVTQGQPVGLAWFSPDCKHFSKAKGGKPVEKKIRGLAWVVVKWARTVKPRVIMLENVEEFEHWGPLQPDGRPCPARKGLTFRRWRAQLENCGYRIEMRQLRGCDYGAPTIRKRLFIIARCDGRPIVWPKPTHGPGRKPYRTAAECIDWSIPCPSIFERSRPLAEATMRRIATGIYRYVINCADPFIVPITHGGSHTRTHSIDEPLRTVTTAHRGELALITPYMAATSGPSYAQKPRPADAPINTLTTDTRASVVVPTLIQCGYGERPGQAPRVPGLEKPLGTTVASNKHALVAAFLAQHNGGPRNKNISGRRADAPLSTLMSRGTQQQIVTSHLLKLKGTSKDGQPIDTPLHTVQAAGTHFGEVRAFLIKYYSSGDGKTGTSLRKPMPTIPTRDRIGLVTIAGTEYAIVDIGMRMLQPRELFRAQGFGDDYIIDPVVNGKPLTKTAQVRMVGNSVCPPIAEALVRANFRHEQKYEAVA